MVKVAYLNCSKRGDGEDYNQLCVSILIAISVARRHNENIDKTLENVFDELWKKNLLLQPGLRDKMVEQINNPILAEAAKNLPVFGTDNFRSVRPKAVRSANHWKKNKLQRSDDERM